MTAHAPGKIAITVPLVFLLGAVVLVLLVSHGVTFEGLNYNGSSSSRASSQPPSNVAAASNGSVRLSAGPEDAGPGVVNPQGGVTSCQPRPCRR